MASRIEKKIGIIVGGIIGGVQGYLYCKKHNIVSKEQWKYIVAGGASGSGSGYLGAVLFGSNNDTVNYRLLKNGQLVYHGITYEDRFVRRGQEHINKGLKFDKVLKDKPKSRLDALLLERKRIKKHRPIYNVQHNNDY